MTAKVAVTCKAVAKDLKDARKEAIKERKEVKETAQDRKDMVEGKGRKEMFERPGGLGDLGGGGLSGTGSGGSGDDGDSAGLYAGNEMLQQQLAMLEARLMALETAQAGAAAQPFISAELRPDLVGQMQADPAAAELQQRMAGGDRDAKVAFDNLPPCN